MVQASRRKHHYIYKITRTDGSGRYYIGMHSTDDMDDGYFGSGKLITRSLKKYGKEKHAKEILEHLSTREALKLREKELVNEELLGDKLCMNLKLGGEGGWDTARKMLKFSSYYTSGKCTERAQELCKKMNDNKTPESRSAVMLKAWEDDMEKMSKGIRVAKIAALSESSRAKRLESFVKNAHQQGSSNSQFRTCWITKNKSSIRVPKVDLEKYIREGYIQGRKMNK